MKININQLDNLDDLDMPSIERITKQKKDRQNSAPAEDDRLDFQKKDTYKKKKPEKK